MSETNRVPKTTPWQAVQQFPIKSATIRQPETSLRQLHDYTTNLTNGDCKKVKVAHKGKGSPYTTKMGVNSFYFCYPTARRLRFEPRPCAPESSTLTTRLPSQPNGD